MIKNKKHYEQEEVSSDEEPANVTNTERFYYKLNPKIRKLFDIILCSLVRLVFFLQASFCIYYLTTFNDNFYYLILTVGLVLIVADSIYIVVQRNGKEHMWFSISSFSYTIIFLTLIWSLVITKYDTNDYDCSENNTMLEERNYWLFVCFFVNIYFSHFN